MIKHMVVQSLDAQHWWQLSPRVGKVLLLASSSVPRLMTVLSWCWTWCISFLGLDVVNNAKKLQCIFCQFWCRAFSVISHVMHFPIFHYISVASLFLYVDFAGIYRYAFFILLSSRCNFSVIIQLCIFHSIIFQVFFLLSFSKVCIFSYFPCVHSPLLFSMLCILHQPIKFGLVRNV